MTMPYRLPLFSHWKLPLYLYLTFTLHFKSPWKMPGILTFQLPFTFSPAFTFSYEFSSGYILAYVYASTYALTSDFIDGSLYVIIFNFSQYLPYLVHLTCHTPF